MGQMQQDGQGLSTKSPSSVKHEAESQDHDPYRLYVQGTPWMGSKDYWISTRSSTASYLELELIPRFNHRVPADAELQRTTWQIYPCWYREQQKGHARWHGIPFVKTLSIDPRPTGRAIRWWRSVKSAVLPPRTAVTSASGADKPPDYTSSDRGGFAAPAPAWRPTDTSRAFRDGPPPASPSLTYHEAYLEAWSWQLGYLCFSHPTLRGPILLRLWRPRECVVAFGARRPGVTREVRDCVACGKDTSKWRADDKIQGHVVPNEYGRLWCSTFGSHDSHVAKFIATN